MVSDYSAITSWYSLHMLSYLMLDIAQADITQMQTEFVRVAKSQLG